LLQIFVAFSECPNFMNGVIEEKKIYTKWPWSVMNH